MNSFYQLFKINVLLFVRNKSGIFWTLLMPAFIYFALSVLPIGKGASPTDRYSNYVLPGIISMIIMQGGIYGLAYWMTDLKSRGVIKRFLVTPLRTWELVLALVSARLLVTIAQTIILTLLGVFVFHAQFVGNFFSVFLFVIIGGAIFLLIGLLISNFATSYESAAPITSAVGLPLTFLGNIFFPIDGLPKALKIFAQMLPITYLSDGLRQAYLFPFDLQKIGKDLLIVTAWLIAVLLITIFVFRLRED